MSNDGPIYHKFTVTRVDGQHYHGGKHFKCDYFVLDITHDPFALPALTAYAEECRSRYPQLADSLKERIREREREDDR